MFIELVDGIPTITEEGKNLVFVKKFKADYPLSESNYFTDAIAYIYYVNHRGSILRNRLPAEKGKYACEYYIPGRNPSDFDRNKHVKKLTKEFISTQLTFTEKIRENLISDLQELMDHSSSIPLFRKQKVQHTIHDHQFFCSKCETTQTQDIPINVTILIDNSVEKNKAIEMVDRLMVSIEKMDDKIKKEAAEEKRNKAHLKRIFDN